MTRREMAEVAGIDGATPTNARTRAVSIGEALGVSATAATQEGA